jgi:GntR family transcriptional regulator
VAAGLLRTGDRLPTVRALAARLGLATNTVARAYQELEADGLVSTRRRVGTVVTAGAGGGRGAGHRGRARRRGPAGRTGPPGGDGEAQVLAVVRGALLRDRTAPVPSPE